MNNIFQISAPAGEATAGKRFFSHVPDRLWADWRWQLRTFWLAAGWLLVAGVLMLTLIGIPAALLAMVVTGVWVLYRVVRGWLALGKGRELPG